MVHSIPLCICVLSCVQLFATPWTVAHQTPLSKEFFRQEYWSGLLFPSLGDLPNPGIKPSFLVNPALAPTVPSGKPSVPLTKLWSLLLDKEGKQRQERQALDS